MAQVRQQPLTTEKDFLAAIDEAAAREDTIFVQWKDVDDSSPEVVTAENFIWYQADPNDAWWYIENGVVRGWKLFPNSEERNLPWQEIDINKNL